MSLRIGVDLDGTVADLATIYRACALQLFGEATGDDTPDDLDAALQDDKARLKAEHEESRRRRLIWDAVRRTDDFWMQLPPVEEGALARLYDAAVARNWEVYFTTQRPISAGRSVQAQSQAWLAEQGFPGACVLALRRSRGRIAHLLDLDFLIDDLAQNCVDVLADSRCRPLLMSREPDPAAEESARNLGIAVVRSMDDAIAHICAPAEPPRGGWARAMKALRLS